MLLLFLLLHISTVNFGYAITTVRVLFVNEVNKVAEQALDVAIDYITRNPQLGVQVEVQKVVANKNDSTNFLNSICSIYDNMLSLSTPPHLIYDTTRVGYISETVKYFTAALGLATISASFGNAGDLRQWRALTEQQEGYLVQVRPPADLLVDILRPMVIHQKIPNCAIFHDDTYVLQHKYKSLFLNFATRHTIFVVNPNIIRHQLVNARELDIANFFVLGNATTVRVVLEGACVAGLLTRRCAWHVITSARMNITFHCKDANVLVARPTIDVMDNERMNVLKKEYGLVMRPVITAVFYFDLFVHAVVAVKNMLMKGGWPSEMPYITCDEYTGKNTPSRHEFNLKKYFDNDIPFPPVYGTFVLDKNGQSAMQFSMEIVGVQIENGTIKNMIELATWDTGYENNFTLFNASLLKSYINDKFFRVVTVEQKPFIYVDASAPRGFRGYCIDLLDEIARLCGFNYDIRLTSDGTWGSMDSTGCWSGVVRELLDHKAEIGLGAMSVIAEREAVVDFSIPYYDMVGIGILMKQPMASKSLFKFLTVLENDVWMCVLGAYLFTSLLMYLFDRLSPFSFRNTRHQPHIYSTREFTFRECLWFCITSLTPQGGGEAPRGPASRLVAATWWLFGFIMIASYTANLAAFLTVSRLDSTVDSLEDLAKQYKIAYAPINGSSAMTYFERMASIEEKFYELWKDMSLNDTLQSHARSNLAVWEYPLSDKYSKMWLEMQRTGLPADEAAAVARVRTSKPERAEGFAYIGDATDLRYLRMTNCDFRLVGEEFSKKPYAIAIQKGHPLKEQVDNAILSMVNRRQLTLLKDKWWSLNPEASTCEEGEATGISIQNIAGVFIVVLAGTSFAVVALVCNHWRRNYILKYRQRARGKLPAVKAVPTVRK